MAVTYMAARDMRDGTHVCIGAYNCLHVWPDCDPFGLTQLNPAFCSLMIFQSA